MEVKVDKRYPLAVDAARAWLVLRDVPVTASCMPGAAISEQVDATHYKGTVKVKVGPANAAFGGEIEVRALDETRHLLQMFAKGADRGGSSASMDLTASIEAGDTPDSSVLVGVAVVVVNGKFAQFGGRLMVQVSDMLLAQFADNFRATASAMPLVVPPTHDAVSCDSTAAPVAVVAATAGAPAASAATATVEPAPTLPPPTSVSPVTSVPSSAAPTPKASEINGLAIVWSLIKNWFAGLFGKRT